MLKQIIFLIVLIVTAGVFAYTVNKIKFFFSLTKAFPIGQFGKRFETMMTVAFGQTKIFRQPVIGLLHALVFWGFCVITIGSLEMIIDGIFGLHRSFYILGILYDIITGSGDVFALIVLISLIVFLVRRLFLNIKRFHGIEMKSRSHNDALIALTIITLLMISLLGMNTFYYLSCDGICKGTYPVSKYFAGMFAGTPLSTAHTLHEVSWWMHILLIFIFANILPYSKHFHVFLSIPNVYLSRLEPLGKLNTMERITTEVKMMMNPETAYASAPADEQPPERFGVKDVTDGTWKNYLDSLACTECGRCTSVCPANITGKKLSPRKIMMDFRRRMYEKGSGLLANGATFDDQKTLLRDYISEEELWACTTCNACANECPININHPSLIVDMRRYLVMEEASAPGQIKAMFSNIENNGAPWQFSPEDRLIWANDIGFELPVMANLAAQNKTPEYLYWVGCAGAFDDRYKKAARQFAKTLNHLGVDFAVLGKEETCTGDPAKRAGNEMLYQMQALMNIQIFEQYGIKKIITTCPHCYNIFKNEYPDLGLKCEVVHHTQFLSSMIESGNIKLDSGVLKDKKITFHDPCYMGRANSEYQAPRNVLNNLSVAFTETKRNKSFALCCGAGGAQMFKEAEKGTAEVYAERTLELLGTNPDIVATACPFCMTMITDGIKYQNKEEQVKTYDIAELVAQSLGI